VQGSVAEGEKLRVLSDTDTVKTLDGYRVGVKYESDYAL